jgi:hypothetical protein
MTSSQPVGPAAVIVSADHLKTLLAALDDAAEYKRDRAATCADCADQSCTTCHQRLQAADAYDQIAAQMIQATEAAAGRQRAPGHVAPASDRPQTSVDPEAGQ